MVVFLSLDVGALEVDIGEEVAKDKSVITSKINRKCYSNFRVWVQLGMDLSSPLEGAHYYHYICLKNCNHFNSFAFIKSRV